jgi:hypothetical protein
VCCVCPRGLASDAATPKKTYAPLSANGRQCFLSTAFLSTRPRSWHLLAVQALRVKQAAL